MNERIRELLEQAKAESNQWLGSKPAITITYDELEKFAELIIRECSNRIDYWESRQGEHSDDLLKHFGVGE
jgi:hypothetical protein